MANVWVGCVYLRDSADSTFQTLQAYRTGRLDRSLEMNGERPIPASSLALSTPYRSYTSSPLTMSPKPLRMSIPVPILTEGMGSVLVQSLTLGRYTHVSELWQLLAA